ncbi:hypothetical protein GUITHDRAFT_161113 [Guillardia theta CCMP2712]|uniref:tRNA pseudouridine synthase n=1 Tax=Guillardia theta (strain CCMP2712) TaxID=905079 RepID=L1JX46_GUITC|nr:hypothetical protein GUITHDRAFT_161113 [Guillardia theta CCMP2712]EKX52927.1 hypothetical protein GUITHDRAFT_161113 [Guillardia theta CCMP2712]|eukprot:XP_005839907.1 hypothetical protein GUITHDRAFT_161113 [Guillardia theta CCMP2712]
MLLASQTSLSPPRVNFQTFLFLLLFALSFVALARQVTSTSTTSRFLAQPEEMAEQGAGKGSKKKEREGRKFDFSKHASRHIAIELSYLGWDFKGFASQEDTNETIEGHLFAALSKTCLIPSRASSSYSRCARTDKGVSALGQVVSLRELPYLQMINALLPPTIRAIAWFACSMRSYKYFFVRADMNIEGMRAAAKLLEGSHDFRNFCKIDSSKPNLTFTRHIISFDIIPVVEQETESRYSVWSMDIKATAFLWHQVRAMAAILFAVGRGELEENFVSYMLDISRCPQKPHYNIASEEPLLLYHCHFPRDLVCFVPPLASHVRNEQVLDAICSQLVCRSALADAMRTSLCSRLVRLGASSETQRRATGKGEEEANGAMVMYEEVDRERRAPHLQGSKQGVHISHAESKTSGDNSRKRKLE